MSNLYTKLSKERKELQDKGLVPLWYSTGSYQIFKDKYEYQTEGRSVRGQFERIAKTAAENLKGTVYEDEAEQKFFDLLWKGWLSPSTPVLANMGTTRGMSVSCSGSSIGDSVHGFYDTLHETAMLTKNGFGTSAYLGDIRPRGSAISVGGKASGVLPVFKDYVNAMRNIAQGTARRGAWAGYLEITHGDFDELADHVYAEPDDANVGWIITDKFIEELESGDKEAIRRFQKVMKLKMVTGKGYFCFIDKINANRPLSYVNNELKVKASNLCVAGDTLILTDKGNVEIQEVEGQQVNVWNGEKFSKVQVHKTGVNKVLLEVKTSSGEKLKCTPEHKFHLAKSSVVKQAKELSQGDKLIEFNLPDGSAQCFFIESVKEIPGLHCTYCFTEPLRNMGMFNGLLTGNCDEITLFADNEHSFSCVLSSMNVYRYDEWKDTSAVFWATVFLDCVAEDFIRKAKGVPGLEKAVRFTEKGRALGLGQCGFHSLLQEKMIPFESLDAQMLSQEIAKHIWDKSEEASKELAMNLGEPEWCKGTGLRNSHRLAIAPTKSTALLMGGISEGINPDPAMTYTQLTSAGEVNRVNPILLDLMKKKGVYSAANIQQVIDDQGSVQGVAWLTDEEKLVFKTAFEINQKVIIRMAASRGLYIDQWQSLNLFFASDESPAWIAEVHREAFLNERILGLYYIYTQAGVQASKGDECIACS